MEKKELIERLRTEALFQRVQFSRILLASELEEAADTIETLEAQLTELQAKYDKLNDFEQSQCAILLARLKEKDKQLSLAEDFIHRVGPDAMEAYRLFIGPKEAGEEATHE